MLGGVAAGAMLLAYQEYGWFIGMLSGGVLFVLTVVSYGVADLVYGNPGSTGDSSQTLDDS